MMVTKRQKTQMTRSRDAIKRWRKAFLFNLTKWHLKIYARLGLKRPVALESNKPPKQTMGGKGAYLLVGNIRQDSSNDFQQKNTEQQHQILQEILKIRNNYDWRSDLSGRFVLGIHPPPPLCLIEKANNNINQNTLQYSVTVSQTCCPKDIQTCHDIKSFQATQQVVPCRRST